MTVYSFKNAIVDIKIARLMTPEFFFGIQDEPHASNIAEPGPTGVECSGSIYGWPWNAAMNHIWRYQYNNEPQRWMEWTNGKSQCSKGESSMNRRGMMGRSSMGTS